jgi:hypothetical protein
VGDERPSQRIAPRTTAIADTRQDPSTATGIGRRPRHVPVSAAVAVDRKRTGSSERSAHGSRCRSGPGSPRRRPTVACDGRSRHTPEGSCAWIRSVEFDVGRPVSPRLDRTRVRRHGHRRGDLRRRPVDGGRRDRGLRARRRAMGDGRGDEGRGPVRPSIRPSEGDPISSPQAGTRRSCFAPSGSPRLRLGSAVPVARPARVRQSNPSRRRRRCSTRT